MGSDVIELAMRHTPPPAEPSQGPHDAHPAVSEITGEEIETDREGSKSAPSYGSSKGSAFSGRSFGSIRSGTSCNSKSSRRGRRTWPNKKQPHISKPTSKAKGNPAKVPQVEYISQDNEVQIGYYCTFCDNDFTKRQEWARHEESVHVPQTLYVCNPPYSLLRPAVSPYDGSSYPSDEQLAFHGHFSCRQKPEEERTFYRKDYLRQHLKQKHKVERGFDISNLLNEWRIPAEPLQLGDPALHCGFCGFQVETWRERVGHVAQHFKNGFHWVDWWPERIFNVRSAPDTGKVPDLAR